MYGDLIALDLLSVDRVVSVADRPAADIRSATQFAPKRTCSDPAKLLLMADEPVSHALRDGIIEGELFPVEGALQ